tara:strand:- start:21914 stop:23590 length:1677 start_codon:yes stop_codon:yes gene_type:complete
MNIRNILNEGSSHTSKLRQVTSNLVRKWEKTGLLEGLASEMDRNGVATLLENQAKQLVKEASVNGTVSNSEEWAGVALPLVRRIFSEIAAKDFVSVQPMNLPSGLVFYLDFKYGTGQPGFTTGSGRFSQADSVFGISDTSSDPSGGLYGAGRFGYSINEAVNAALPLSCSTAASTTATTLHSGTYQTASLVSDPSGYNYDTTFSQSNAAAITAGTVFKLTIKSASLAGLDTKGIRAFRLEGSNITDSFPQFTKISGANIDFVVKGTAAKADDDIFVKYQKQPTDISRGDFEQTKAGLEASPETDLEIPELNVEMKSEAIVAKTRKLKAQWTPEFAQDLNAYHSIDAEAELTSMLSEYISQEIDLEILDMLIQDAKTTGFWSTQVGREWNGSAFSDYSTTAAQASSFNQGQWFQTLGTVIASVSNKIHQKTLRGGANFLVVSPEVATVIESIPGYASSADNGDAQFAFGVTKVGSLSNRFQVYKNPYMKENVILMGYRGNQFLETGAVYAPYIPLIMTPLVYDPKSFTPRKGVMTRYAKKMLRGEFYGKIFVDGLHKIQ